MELSDTEDMSLRPREAGRAVPLTFGQSKWWNELAKQAAPHGMRICAASLRVLGLLDTSHLQTSIEAVVQRHESLRTRIVSMNDGPRQKISETSKDNFELIDLEGAACVDIEREARRLAQEFIDRKIDLRVGPLFEARLLRLASRDHVLILALDHIVSDAASYAILTRDLWTLYSQDAQRPFAVLPQLAIQFADYAVWQQQTAEIWRKKHEAYWIGRLANAPRTRIQPVNSLVEEKNLPGVMLYFPFGKRLSEALRGLARREKTPLSVIVLTVYAALMSHWCGQADLVIGLISHGRHGRPELQDMIGLLSSVLHLRIEGSVNDSFLNLLRRTGLELQSAYQHQDFDRASTLVPECTTDLYFNWLPARGTRAPVENKQSIGEVLRMQPFPLRVDWPFNFLPFFSDTDAGVNVTVVYLPSIFAKTRIEWFGNNLRLFAAEFAGNPNRRIGSMVPTS